MPPPRKVPILRQVERGAQLLSRSLTERLGDDLTDGEAHVLFHLEHLPRHVEPSIRELQRAFGIRPSTLTAIVDRLERQGLVERKANPTDRRSYLVVPTESARSAIARVSKVLEGIEAAVTSRVNAEEMAGFSAVMQALEEALR